MSHRAEKLQFAGSERSFAVHVSLGFVAARQPFRRVNGTLDQFEQRFKRMLDGLVLNGNEKKSASVKPRTRLLRSTSS